MQIIEYFRQEMESGRILAILPVSRFVIESEFTIGRYLFLPAGSFNINKLGVVPNKALEIAPSIDVSGGFQIQRLAGQDLREVTTSATGVTKETFEGNTLIAFAADVNWDKYLSQSHSDDRALLSKLSSNGEKVLDLIRFNFCRMDLPETLPGKVGTWNCGQGFSAALLYNLLDNRSRIAAGSVLTHAVVQGIGLELDKQQVSLFNEAFEDYEDTVGEVGNIIKVALSLFTDVLESNDPTSKFVRAMSLLDFLASGSKFETLERIKTNIVTHVAKDKKHYHELCVRFKELMGGSNYDGYRTQVVHMGKDISSILENDPTKLKKLNRELQLYIGKAIHDMMKMSESTWNELNQYRESRRQLLKV